MNQRSLSGDGHLGGADWQPLVKVTDYDRSPGLSDSERIELADLLLRRPLPSLRWYAGLPRLLKPLNDVMDATLPVRSGRRNVRQSALRILLREMQTRGNSFWAWAEGDWCAIIGCSSSKDFVQRYGVSAQCRQHLMAICYLLGGVTDVGRFGKILQQRLASYVF